MLLNNPNAACSIVDVATKVGLSRVRFYQLRKQGVFPEPDGSGRAKRPFYSLELQQRCLEIRETGIGHNGKPVVFNTPRKKKSNKCKRPRSQPGPRYEQFADILRQWGRNVTHTDIENAINTLYPEGLAQHPDEGMVLRDLVDYFNGKTFRCSTETIE